MARTSQPLPDVRQREHVNTGFVSSVRKGLSIQIETKGLDEAIDRIQKYAPIGSTENKRVAAGMRLTTNLVRTRANGTVPYRTGEMKRSLFGIMKKWTEGNVTGKVGSDGNRLKDTVIPFVLEGGRKANKGQARKSTTEYFYENGNRRRKILGYQDVGAIKPRRWLWRAYAQVKDQIETIWKNVLDLITQDLAGRK
jgi:hypothetical protein